MIEYERLLKIATKMHLWIFLHSGDEQRVYDGLGLTDEENMVLGYSGQLVLREKKAEDAPTVDAVERKRGEWIRRPSPDKYHCGYVICPFCNVEYVESDEYNFCPNCGADMRGENNG